MAFNPLTRLALELSTDGQVRRLLQGRSDNAGTRLSADTGRQQLRLVKPGREPGHASPYHPKETQQSLSLRVSAPAGDSAGASRPDPFDALWADIDDCIERMRVIVNRLEDPDGAA